MTEIVYCVENPAMPGLVKIGTTHDIEQRLNVFPVPEPANTRI